MSITCTYSNNFKRSHIISKLHIIFKKKNTYYLIKKEFSICGRVFRKRIMGKSTFLELKDISGTIQLYLSNKFSNNYKEIIKHIKLGDIIGVKGLLFKTKTKELSLNVSSLEILAENFNLFPDKRLGLADLETCYRERYLDLMVNEKTKNIFLLRSKIISKIRNFFVEKQFLEVETPMIQQIPGGAEAEPFVTYHNSLGTNLYFRIAPELYLKRLIVGGFEKIFEIGKNFRNEGMSSKHHPEFTMIEFYQAYSNYQELMLLTEELLKYLAKNCLRTTSILYDNVTLNFSKNFEKINFTDAILKYCNNININDLKNQKFLHNYLLSNNIQVEKSLNIYELQSKIFDNFVEVKLIQPTFILHHPTELSPLSKKTTFNDSIVERFELYICGKELANGFSELNDPIDQEKRFIDQLKKKNNNVDVCYDKDYINALKYGLPPTAGEGIGIDRLIMLFTNTKNIKDIILFPFMKNKHE